MILLSTYSSPGRSNFTFAQQLIISQSTVSRILKRFKVTGGTENKHKTSSREHLALTVQEIRQIGIVLEKDPTATARKIRDLVSGKSLLLSFQTMQRYLKRVGRLAFGTKSHHDSRHLQRLTRKKWAEKHKNLDFSSLIFSDETYIELAESSTLCPVRRSKGENV